MICSQCGTQIPEHSQNCPQCGMPLYQMSNGPVPPPGVIVSGAATQTPPTTPTPPATPTSPTPPNLATPPMEPHATPVPSAPPQANNVGAPVPQDVTTAADAPLYPSGVSNNPMPPTAASGQTPPPENTAPYGQQKVYPEQQSIYPDQPTPAFIPEPAPAPVENKPKKSKKPWIIAGAAVLVVALGVGIFFGVNAFIENQRSEAYAAAVASMDAEDYESALAAFNELGDYEDSPILADYCTKSLSYVSAEASLENKDYEAARNAFADLGTFKSANERVTVCDAWLAFVEANALTDEGKYEEASGKSVDFSSVSEVRNAPEVVEWFNKNGYGLADQYFNNGEFYRAYLKFNSLSGYEDADARAEACKQPFPATGVLYHNEGYHSSDTDLTFDPGSTGVPYYIKVYNGETLVSILVIHPGQQATISIPAGDYTFKSATGDAWFGENDMFGDDGTYKVLLFDGSNETVHLDANMIYTVTMFVVGGGNVGDRTEDPSNF